MSDKQQTGTGRGWQHLARQFDLMAKGCRSLGLDSVEDDMRSLETGALAGDVTAEQLADLVHYDYSTNQDGKEAARLLFEAVLSDLRERNAYDDTKAALEKIAQRANESGTGESGLLETIHAMHEIARDCLSGLNRHSAPSICDAETVQTLLDLLNPLHESLDEQTYDRKHHGEFAHFDMPDDHDLDVNVTARMERDLTQAVCILEDRKRQFAALSNHGEKQ